MYDNDDAIPNNLANSYHNQDVKSTNPSQQQQARTGKATRSGLFTGSIFTRVSKTDMQRSGKLTVKSRVVALGR